MPISVKLRDPFSYSLLLTVILIALVVIPAVILLIMKLRNISFPETSRKPKKVHKAKPNMFDLKRHYLDLIDSVKKRYDDGVLDDRASYIELSSIVRQFVQETSGIKAVNLTLSEIEALGFGSLSSLIAQFYSPEFSRDSRDSDILSAVSDARTVIREWN